MVDDPNVDMISDHFYPPDDFLDRITRLADKTRGKKPFMVRV
jgi:hypothetical protein